MSRESHVTQLREGYDELPTSRPQPGDSVTVAGLDGVFTVLSCDGRALYTLRSQYGTQLRAGVLVVRRA
ncbi:MAG: hypothetical protein L0H73_13660 [Nitrococcus sp.]|nr:hypothetical protein [Nitrococcus sp.]